MTLTEELHQTLKEMMEQIEAGSAADNGVSLADRLRRIDEIRDQMDVDAPQMLRHYLEKRSYSKALDFLEGRDETAAPNC